MYSGGARVAQERTSHGERKSTGTSMGTASGGERRKEYTSTGTQCDLGDERMTPRHVSVGTQSVSDDTVTVDVGTMHGVCTRKEILKPVADDTERIFVSEITEEVFAEPKFDDISVDDPFVVVSLERTVPDPIDSELFRPGNVPQEANVLSYQLEENDDDSKSAREPGSEQNAEEVPVCVPRQGFREPSLGDTSEPSAAAEPKEEARFLMYRMTEYDDKKPKEVIVSGHKADEQRAIISTFVYDEPQSPEQLDADLPEEEAHYLTYTVTSGEDDAAPQLAIDPTLKESSKHLPQVDDIKVKSVAATALEDVTTEESIETTVVIEEVETMPDVFAPEPETSDRKEKADAGTLPETIMTQEIALEDVTHDGELIDTTVVIEEVETTPDMFEQEPETSDRKEKTEARTLPETMMTQETALEDVTHDGELIDTTVVIEEVETTPDMFEQEPETSDRKEKTEAGTLPEKMMTQESVKSTHPLGNIVEGEESKYATSVTVKPRKKLMKQKTFPLYVKDEEQDEDRHVVVTRKESEDARRLTLPSQRRGSSYEQRRSVSIEKLKSSMDDVNLTLGRRKSEARDLLLAKTGIDYHSFLIWIMFSEGELNNVKCVSATYTILMEQKAYLQVLFVIIRLGGPYVDYQGSCPCGFASISILFENYQFLLIRFWIK